MTEDCSTPQSMLLPTLLSDLRYVAFALTVPLVHCTEHMEEVIEFIVAVNKCVELELCFHYNIVSDTFAVFLTCMLRLSVGDTELLGLTQAKRYILRQYRDLWELGRFLFAREKFRTYTVPARHQELDYKVDSITASCLVMCFCNFSVLTRRGFPLGRWEVDTCVGGLRCYLWLLE